MKSLLMATSLFVSMTSFNLAQATLQSASQLTITAQATSVAPIEAAPKPLTSNSGQAAQEGRVVVMAIKGQISKKVLESIRNSIGSVNGDPIPAGLIVLLDSPGGDGIAAMKIGEMLRANKAHVFVTGQCASACIFVLASGVVRGAPAYTVGIHRGRITKTDENAKILEEIDIKSNPQAKALLERFEKAVPVYFAQMGMPPELFQAMQSHQYKGVYRLSNEEITFYGLTGFEPKYLDMRAELYEKMTGPYHMDKDELHRRTLKVASRCAEFDQKHTAFINCYKQVLKDPFLN
jgi:hypothetical protein